MRRKPIIFQLSDGLIKDEEHYFRIEFRRIKNDVSHPQDPKKLRIEDFCNRL